MLEEAAAVDASVLADEVRAYISPTSHLYLPYISSISPTRCAPCASAIGRPGCATPCCSARRRRARVSWSNAASANPNLRGTRTALIRRRERVLY